MKIQGTSSFPGSETHSIIHGTQARRKPPEAILSRAAEVFISRRGAQLQKGDTDMDALLTPAELALAADQKEIDDKREKKSQAADIEARIRTDVTLSDKDKSVLQKQADKLKKEGMTDEDRLAQLYRERGVWEKRSMSDTAAPDEKIAAGSMIVHYDGRIDNLRRTMQEKETHKMHLRTQAIQERADLEAAAQKEQEKIDDAIIGASGDDASALETLLRYEAQRKAAKDNAAVCEDAAPAGQSQTSST